MKAKDIKIGDRLNKWLVVSGPNIARTTDPSGKTRRRIRWTCLCTGCSITEKIVDASTLADGTSKGCFACTRRHDNIHIGFISNDWTVLKRSSTPKNKTHWLCKCKCGNKVDVYAPDLNNGKSKRCLTCGTELSMKTKHVKAGDKYGKWTVLSVTNIRGNGSMKGSRKCICKCSCGTTKTLEQDTLRSKRTKQCKKCSAINSGGFRRSDFINIAKRKGRSESCVLYVIKCVSDDENFFKIGITTNDVKERFRSEKTLPYKYDIIYEFFMPAVKVWNLEKELHRAHKKANLKYVPKLEFGGMYECFSELLPDIEDMLK